MDTKSADNAFGGHAVSINGVKFDFGAVIRAIVTFNIMAFVLFMIVKFVNRLKEVSTSQKIEAGEEAKEPVEEYLEQIRDLLSK